MNVNLKDNIKNIFSNMSYSEQYSNDIWTTVIILIIFTFIVVYYNILNYIKSYRSNWDNIKCNPLVMPFVGIIKSHDASTDSNFVENNFKTCLNDLNKEISDKSKASINGMFNTFNKTLESAGSISSSIMDNIDHLFTMLTSMLTEFTNRLTNLTSETSQTFEQINNFLGQILGVISNLYNQIILVTDSSKLILSLMALAFLSAIVLPSVIATVSLIVIFFGLLVISALSVLFCIGCWALPLVPLALIAVILLLIWTIFVIVIYTIMSNSASNILSKTLAPVSNTPGIVMKPPPSVPSF